MKARPILFSGLMVRAIIDGRKTQTRRLVEIPHHGDVLAWRYVRPPDFEGWRFEETTGLDRQCHDLRCPFGGPGDRLWVKEGLRRGEWEGMPEGSILYAADDAPAWDLTQPCAWGWKRDTLPGMFCPRGLSRITLEVTAVRVERLQEVSDADARAEGLDLAERGKAPERFAELWDSLNGKRAPWASNPWVWVVTFKRVDAPEALDR